MSDMRKFAERAIHRLGRTDVVSTLSLGCIGLIAVIPPLLPFHGLPLQSFYDEWLALVLGFVGCIAFLSRRFWANSHIPHVALYALALLVIVVAQGSLISHPYLAQTLVPAIYLTWAILLMVLATWLKTAFGLERVVTAFAWFLFAGGLLQAFAGLVQYLGVAGWLAEWVAYKMTAAVHGNIAQANLFATHLTLATAALLFLFSCEKLSWALTFALITFFAFIVTLSGSRAVTIYAAGIVTLSAFCYYKNRDKQYLRLLLGSVYFLVAFIGSQYILTWVNPWLAAQLADISLNSDPFSYLTALDKLPAASAGIGLRTSEWHKAWIMFIDSKLLGVGVGNYAWHSFTLQSLPEFNSILKPQLFSHAHNIFIQLLAETGILGIGVFVALIVGWVRQFSRGWPSTHTWLIGSGLLVLFIHSNLEFPLWYSHYLGIAAVLLALGETRTVRVTFSSNLGRTAVALALLLIGSTLVMTLKSYREIASYPDPFVEPQEQINALLAHGGNPILKPYAESTLLVLMPANKNAIEEKLTISTRVFRRNPDRYKAYKQVTLLALNRQLTDAEELLGQVSRAYPSELVTYIANLKNFPDPDIQALGKYAATLAIR